MLFSGCGGGGERGFKDNAAASSRPGMEVKNQMLEAFKKKNRDPGKVANLVR
ncbi:MAG: hypothetical protein U0790_26650 [Isosphaeraceae bacterium]